MKKVEDYILDVKDPLPFSFPGFDDQVAPSPLRSAEREINTHNDENAAVAKGADPPSYDEAMKVPSFQEQVDSDLARELQSKLNSE
jgi:hypothetical protein